MRPIMQKRVTQSDVARKLGVHNSTVSLAMRNSPSLPETTRVRIRRVAEKMGYARDPLLQALVAYRDLRPSQAALTRIAYIATGELASLRRAHPHRARLFSGARQRASELGFQLSRLSYPAPDEPAGKLAELLAETGSTALVLESAGEWIEALSLVNWSGYSAVRVGNLPGTPPLHAVTCDYPGAVRLALRKIHAAGWSQVGLVLPEDLDPTTKHQLLAGCEAERQFAGFDGRISLIDCSSTSEPGSRGLSRERVVPDAAPVLQWFREQAPAVLLSAVPGLLSELQSSGMAVPRDLSFVDLFTESPTSSVTGVRDNAEHVGREAIDLLVRELRGGARGQPTPCYTTIVESTWVHGQTLSRRA
ncbi:hypothetical protein DB347_07250 [Opitutaceae bacterium EW11]|nr:hypothetical protein DB347_07250 [Opitutaceae bacterium EW11]